MHPIKYMAKVQYRTFENSICTKEYEFMARDKDNARAIAQEIFMTENPKARDVMIGIKFIKPEQYELEHITKVMNVVLNELRKTFGNMSYKEFVNAYVTFQGWGFTKHYEEAEYMIKFRGITLKIVCNQGRVYVDEEEIIYFSEELNRTYVIQNDGVTILIGG